LTNFLSPLNEIQKGIAGGSISGVNLFSEFVEFIEQTNDPFKCWVQTRKSLLDFKKVDRNFLPLDGLVIGVKDNIATDEFPTRMGAENWLGTPGGFDARVIFNLRSSGAFIGGKTVCSEFAVHKRTETVNPRYPDCEPGTSSSGSAAAVAGKQVSVALGTQTAGSIVKPASYCGVIGFKPTFGEIPRTGILKTTELFDTVGFLGRRVSDIWAVFLESRVEGSNFPIHTLNRAKFDSQSFTSILVFAGDGVDDPNYFLRNEFVSFCKSIGEMLRLHVISFELPFRLWEIREAFETVYSKDISYFLSDHNLEGSISPNLKEMFTRGLSVSSSEYQRSLNALASWRRFMRDIPGNPLILSLATSTSAPKIGSMDKMDANLLLTSVGNPQICLPLLRDEFGKLVGVSLSGKRFTDAGIISVANSLFPSDALDLPNFSY
jgi:Asp-tRNA(Asn)/Glu-tRNA(Gln) amidotransferase A subunit family amidase